MILIIAGFVGVTSLGAAGDNLVLKIGSYIPFISTFFMPFRAINSYASDLEAWISLAITVVFCSHCNSLYRTHVCQPSPSDR